MEEDLLGTFRSFSRRKLTLCNRCGKPILRDRARITEEGLAEDTLSGYEELCEECSLPDKENRQAS